MILFTSVTKKTFLKGSVIYLCLATFLILFTIVYEYFSYGESSIFMRTMFVSPILAALLLRLASQKGSWLKNHLSLAFFNSSIAIFVSGGLIKGIVEVSGRHTNIDQPYWYAASLFVILSIISGLFSRKPIE